MIQAATSVLYCYVASQRSERLRILLNNLSEEGEDKLNGFLSSQFCKTF